MVICSVQSLQDYTYCFCSPLNAFAVTLNSPFCFTRPVEERYGVLKSWKWKTVLSPFKKKNYISIPHAPSRCLLQQDDGEADMTGNPEEALWRRVCKFTYEPRIFLLMWETHKLILLSVVSFFFFCSGQPATAMSFSWFNQLCRWCSFSSFCFKRQIDSGGLFTFVTKTQKNNKGGN